MSTNRQMSDTVKVGVLLAMAGGFMDAYSYLCRGKVFANAQTGNLLLLGIHIVEGDWAAMLRYGVPALCFAVGIILAEETRLRLIDRPQGLEGSLHWRQMSILLEIVILCGVSFIPQSANLLANSLTSLACGIQVEAFRKIHGNAIATTMCIGNLRCGTENLCRFIHFRERSFLNKSLLYYGIIIAFVAGAVLGNFVIDWLGEKAMLLCTVLLLSAFLVMFHPEGKE